MFGCLGVLRSRDASSQVEASFLQEELFCLCGDFASERLSSLGMWPDSCDHAMDVSLVDGSVFCAKCFGDGIASSNLTTRKIGALQELRAALPENPQLSELLLRELHFILLQPLIQALADCRDVDLALQIEGLLMDLSGCQFGRNSLDFLENVIRNIAFHLERSEFTLAPPGLPFILSCLGGIVKCNDIGNLGCVIFSFSQLWRLVVTSLASCSEEVSSQAFACLRAAAHMEAAYDMLRSHAESIIPVAFTSICSSESAQLVNDALIILVKLASPPICKVQLHVLATYERQNLQSSPDGDHHSILPRVSSGIKRALLFPSTEIQLLAVSLVTHLSSPVSCFEEPISSHHGDTPVWIKGCISGTPNDCFFGLPPHPAHKVALDWLLEDGVSEHIFELMRSHQGTAEHLVPSSLLCLLTLSEVSPLVFSHRFIFGIDTVLAVLEAAVEANSFHIQSLSVTLLTRCLTIGCDSESRRSCQKTFPDSSGPLQLSPARLCRILSCIQSIVVSFSTDAVEKDHMSLDQADTFCSACSLLAVAIESQVALAKLDEKDFSLLLVTAVQVSSVLSLFPVQPDVKGAAALQSLSMVQRHCSDELSQPPTFEEFPQPREPIKRLKLAVLGTCHTFLHNCLLLPIDLQVDSMTKFTIEEAAPAARQRIASSTDSSKMLGLSEAALAIADEYLAPFLLSHSPEALADISCTNISALACSSLSLILLSPLHSQCKQFSSKATELSSQHPVQLETAKALAKKLTSSGLFSLLLSTTSTTCVSHVPRQLCDSNEVAMLHAQLRSSILKLLATVAFHVLGRTSLPLMNELLSAAGDDRTPSSIVGMLTVLECPGPKAIQACGGGTGASDEALLVAAQRLAVALLYTAVQHDDSLVAYNDLEIALAHYILNSEFPIHSEPVALSTRVPQSPTAANNSHPFLLLVASLFAWAHSQNTRRHEVALQGRKQDVMTLRYDCHSPELPALLHHQQLQQKARSKLIDSLKSLQSRGLLFFSLETLPEMSLPLWMLQQEELQQCCVHLVGCWLQSFTPRSFRTSVPAKSQGGTLSRSQAGGKSSAGSCYQDDMGRNTVEACNRFSQLLTSDETGVVVRCVVAALEDVWQVGTSGDWSPCTAVLQGLQQLLQVNWEAAVALEEAGVSGLIISKLTLHSSCISPTSLLSCLKLLPLLLLLDPLSGGIQDVTAIGSWEALSHHVLHLQRRLLLPNTDALQQLCVVVPSANRTTTGTGFQPATPNNPQQTSALLLAAMNTANAQLWCCYERTAGSSAHLDQKRQDMLQATSVLLGSNALSTFAEEQVRKWAGLHESPATTGETSVDQAGKTTVDGNAMAGASDGVPTKTGMPAAAARPQQLLLAGATEEAATVIPETKASVERGSSLPGMEPARGEIRDVGTVPEVRSAPAEGAAGSQDGDVRVALACLQFIALKQLWTLEGLNPSAPAWAQELFKHSAHQSRTATISCLATLLRAACKGKLKSTDPVFKQPCSDADTQANNFEASHIPLNFFHCDAPGNCDGEQGLPQHCEPRSMQPPQQQEEHREPLSLRTAICEAASWGLLASLLVAAAARGLQGRRTHEPQNFNGVGGSGASVHGITQCSVDQSTACNHTSQCECQCLPTAVLLEVHSALHAAAQCPIRSIRWPACLSLSILLRCFDAGTVRYVAGSYWTRLLASNAVSCLSSLAASARDSTEGPAGAQKGRATPSTTAGVAGAEHRKRTGVEEGSSEGAPVVGGPGRMPAKGRGHGRRSHRVARRDLRPCQPPGLQAGPYTGMAVPPTAGPGSCSQALQGDRAQERKLGVCEAGNQQPLQTRHVRYPHAAALPALQRHAGAEAGSRLTPQERSEGSSSGAGGAQEGRGRGMGSGAAEQLLADMAEEHMEVVAACLRLPPQLRPAWTAALLSGHQLAPVLQFLWRAERLSLPLLAAFHALIRQGGVTNTARQQLLDLVRGVLQRRGASARSHPPAWSLRSGLLLLHHPTLPAALPTSSLPSSPANSLVVPASGHEGLISVSGCQEGGRGPLPEAQKRYNTRRTTSSAQAEGAGGAVQAQSCGETRKGTSDQSSGQSVSVCGRSGLQGAAQSPMSFTVQCLVDDRQPADLVAQCQAFLDAHGGGWRGAGVAIEE